MLDEGTRRAILELAGRGIGSRRIATLLGVSRGAVRACIKRGSSAVPALSRKEVALPYREEIERLYAECKGNLMRVHEELLAQGATLSYTALTGFCRRHGIGQKPVRPAGRYVFAPGQEMQHDTSPHRVEIGGRQVLAQTASLVLAYSRRLYFQLYPRFDRFTCKIFLTDALAYHGGACARCMIDNTHVIVLRGTGREMVPAPEMAAFAQRYSFDFVAHEKGDANRSGRVERPFHYIENNFLAGRTFADWDDLNQRALAWCDEKNATYRRHLHQSPNALFATEQSQIEPLPDWVPEVYRLHPRTVDVEGFVSLFRHRYSVPYTLIGRMLEVRETKDRVRVYHGPREVADHEKCIGDRPERVTDPAHRPPRGRRKRAGPSEEQRRIAATLPEIEGYAAALAQRAQGRGTIALRRLYRMVREYPQAAVIASVRTAQHYGLFDLERLEQMILRRIAGEFFQIEMHDEEGDSDP